MHPVRLRQTVLTKKTKGIIVACVSYQTIALQAFSGSVQELDIYERIEGMRYGNVRWLYFPLQRGERLIEIGVRVRRGSQGTPLCSPSLEVRHAIIIEGSTLIEAVLDFST